MALPMETRLDRILKNRFWRVLQKAEGRNIIYRQGDAKAELCAIFDSVSEETEEVLKFSGGLGPISAKIRVAAVISMPVIESNCSMILL